VDTSGRRHAVLLCTPAAICAAKHGIAGFTKTVALEMAQKNITCNAICPGYVLTGEELKNCRQHAITSTAEQVQIVLLLHRLFCFCWFCIEKSSCLLVGCAESCPLVGL
jgi:3-hydroxybutyrate dehydrogenase